MRPCVSLVVSNVCSALSKHLVISPKQFQQRIKHFPMNTLNPQWFLNEGTDLTYIPSSKSLLRIHGKQKKCCQIYHSVFDPDVIAKIDNGEHMPFSQMSVNLCCYVMTFLFLQPWRVQI